MSTSQIIGLVVVGVVIVLAVVVVTVIAVRARERRNHLRQRFGPEYDRAMEVKDDRKSAERELLRREKRHQKLELKSLPPAVRENYLQKWTYVQEHFVDRPDVAVADADRLVTALMAERGYPTRGYDQQVADLSVEHATTLDHYRRAHEIFEQHGRTQASTEDLRAAMVHYRVLFDDLLRTSAEARDGGVGHDQRRA